MKASMVLVMMVVGAVAVTRGTASAASCERLATLALPLGHRTVGLQRMHARVGRVLLMRAMGDVDLGALAHVSASVPLAVARHGCWIEALAIVFDENFERVGEGFYVDVNFTGGSVFEGVGQRFFDDEKNIVAHVRRPLNS